MCRDITQLRAIDKVKDISDKAAALRVYAERAGNRTMEADATAYRLYAERQAARIMAEMARNGELSRGGGDVRSQAQRRNTGSQRNPVNGGVTGSTPPTLASLGYDKRRANQARILAAIPKKSTFNSRVEIMRTRIARGEARGAERYRHGVASLADPAAD